ncbi:putative kinase [Roseibium album]|nr:putative kinase [Roseibium album]
MNEQTTLHLLCGKVASGKSTLAKSLAAAKGTILLQEDFWLSNLFADELATLSDYVRCSERLRNAMEPHIVDLLRSGLSVVLDFQANTVETRNWMRRIFEAAGCLHQLHVLDVSNDICKARLRARNASGSHEFQVSDDEFDRISSYFERPTDEEGFKLKIHTALT